LFCILPHFVTYNPFLRFVLFGSSFIFFVPTLIRTYIWRLLGAPLPTNKSELSYLTVAISWKGSMWFYVFTQFPHRFMSSSFTF